MGAPEVVRGDFVYHDAFFVSVGVHRHPRASIHELRNLLLPTQKTTHVKDEVGHWYEAQLIHYGLARTRDKNAAKVRLTAAISAENLAVPGSILQMEVAMKKEYTASVRKAKATSAMKAVSGNFDGCSNKRSKRKSDTCSPSLDCTTRVSAKVGNITFEIEQQTGRSDSSAKKQKPNHPSSLTNSATLTRDVKPTNTHLRGSLQQPADQEPTRKKAAKTVVQQNRSPRFRHQHNIVDERSVKQQDDSPVRAATRISYNETYADGPPARNEDIDQTLVSHNKVQGKVHISGLYNLFCRNAYIQAELILKVCRSSQQFWGQFTIGHKSGVLLCSDIEGIGKSQMKTFGWRAEDNMTGVIKFGRGCHGWFQFDGQGSVRGNFNGLFDNDEFAFEGRLQSKNTSITISRIQDKWDDFPRIAYYR